jgi:hypothetical protein
LASRDAPVNSGFTTSVSLWSTAATAGVVRRHSPRAFYGADKETYVGETIVTDAGAYRHLFAPLRIRHTTLPNRVVFAPVCPT